MEGEQPRQAELGASSRPAAPLRLASRSADIEMQIASPLASAPPCPPTYDTMPSAQLVPPVLLPQVLAPSHREPADAGARAACPPSTREPGARPQRTRTTLVATRT